MAAPQMQAQAQPHPHAEWTERDEPQVVLPSKSSAATCGYSVGPVPVRCWSKPVDLDEVCRELCLTNEQGFYVTDLGKVKMQVDAFRRALPNVDVFYSMAANRDKTIVRFLLSEGVGLMCSSEKEIRRAQKLGCPPERIISSNPVRSPHHLNFARVTGVSLCVFDSFAELDNLRTHHPDADLLMRIECGNGTHAPVRFGAAKSDWKELLQRCLDLGLDLVGVAFHVDHDASPRDFAAAVASCREVFDLAESLGIRLEIIDLGGGWSVDEEPHRQPFEHQVEAVRRALDECFGSERLARIRLLAEPGRFLVQSSTVQVTRIIGKQIKGKHCYYFQDDGAFGSFAYIAQGLQPLPVVLPLHRHTAARRLCTLCGPTNEPPDIIAEGVDLPELSLGDWLLYRQRGAYALSLHSRFEGFACERLYYVDTTRRGGSAVAPQGEPHKEQVAG